MSAIRLSICVATYARGAFIGETLENILAQATDEVEVLVVDGASPDNTADVVRALQERHPGLVYHREATNSGVDQDFDKAVGYARGEYCWLLSDDDLLAPGAIARVLAALADGPELVVVNAEVRDRDMGQVLQPGMLALAADRSFGPDENEQLFAATAGYLSFIGGVVIRRSAWLARERAAYYGTLFIHIGVLFQPPALGRVHVIAAPLVRIRYGNAMWTARGFEIWMRKWPRLVWSFAHFSEKARAAVSPRDPAASLKTLLWYRAIGAYGLPEYRAWLAGPSHPHHRLSALVARFPARLANALVALHCGLRGGAGAAMQLYDLQRAQCASATARRLFRRVNA